MFVVKGSGLFLQGAVKKCFKKHYFPETYIMKTDISYGKGEAYGIPD